MSHFSALALAAAPGGMPDLGQQRGLQERRNQPGERLRNDPPKPKRRLTVMDNERRMQAECKRLLRRMRPNGSSS
jgi:hypothetical protein